MGFTECDHKILLSHTNFEENACQNNHVVGISKVGSCYISRLTLALSTTFTGGNVTCQFDNGSEISIGHRRLASPGKLQ